MPSLAEIGARLDRLETENLAMREALAAANKVPAMDAQGASSFSRRRLLRSAGIGAVLAGTAGLAGPLTAMATDGQPVLAGQGNDATGETVVTSSAPRGLVGRTSATAPSNNHTPSGVVGIAFNAAGNNFEDAPSGVLGIASNANGFNFGVRGETSSTSGIGVVGRAMNDAGNGTYGVWGESTGDQSAGVYGIGKRYGVLAHARGAAGVGLYANGGRIAVEGSAGDGGTGVCGISSQVSDAADPPANTGVYGHAPTGRGGQFAGGRAQARLVPSSLARHPNSGARGDLFVDKSGRLWFCKGGSTWKQLA